MLRVIKVGKSIPFESLLRNQVDWHLKRKPEKITRMIPAEAFKKFFGEFVLDSEFVYCLVIDMQSNIVFANHAYAKFVKKELDEVLAHKVFDFIHPEDTAPFEKLVQDLIAKREIKQCEFLTRNYLGEDNFISIDAHLVEVEGKPYLAGILFEKTKEKKLEQSLQRRNEELEEVIHQSNLFIDTARMGTWVFDLKTQKTIWNDRLLDMFGLSKNDLTQVEHLWKEIIHPEDLEMATTELLRVFNGEESHGFNLRVVRNNGETLYLNSSAIPIFDDTGNVIKLLGAIIDVSEHTRDEMEKARQSKLLRKHSRELAYTNHQIELAESSAQLAIWKLNINKNLVEWNSRHYDLFDITREELEADPFVFEKRIHPEDLPEAKARLEQAKNGEIIENNRFRLVTKSGEVRHIFNTMAPFRNRKGKIIEVHGVNFDVTPLVAAQSAKAQKDQQLAAIANKLPGVVLQYVLDTQGNHRLNYLSDGAFRIWGISQKEVLGDVNLVFEILLEEDLPMVQESIMRSAETMEDWDCTYRIMTPQKELKYLRGMGVPRKGSAGEIIWDSIILDITPEIIQEKAVAEQKEMLNQLTSQVPGMVFIYQLFPNGTDGFGFLSKGAEDIFEIDARSLKEDTQLFWTQVFEEDAELVKKSVQHSANTLSGLSVAFRIKTPSGKIKHLSCSGTPTRLDNGTVQWHSIGSDITEYVQQKKIIASQKEQFQQVANQFPGVIIKFKVDTKGNTKTLYVSDGIEEMFGLTNKQVSEDFGVLWNKHHEDDRQGIQQSLDEALRNNTKWQHIHRYYNSENEVRYMQGFGSAKTFANGSVEWNIITLDITERILAEQNATRSNEMLRTFINAAPTAIFQINPIGQVTDFWNPAAESVFGWTKESVRGKTLPFLNERSMAEFHGIIDGIRDSAKATQYLTHIKNKFGDKLLVDIVATPLFDKSGSLTELVIIANDITELENYRKTIEKNLHEKEILLQEIHHRVKNNLAIISGLLELQAMRDDSSRDMSLIIEARNRIHSIAMVHEQLYQDMDFSHINPKDYYEKLLTKLQANTVSDNPEIEYDLKFDIPPININRAVPLGLLINELFTNSIKYAFNDGKGKLTLHFTKHENTVKVLYQDSGPGFRQEDIEHKNTIGWQLITTLLAQLDSEYTIDSDGKFRLVFTFEEVERGSQAMFT